MLRSFYLLVIIYYINSTFCYDYLNVDASDGWAREGSYGVGYGHKKLRTSRRNFNRKRHQTDSDSVAQFDVADFMQGYGNAVEDNGLYKDSSRNAYRRQKQKESINIGNPENLFSSNLNDKRADNWAESVEDLKPGVADAIHATKTTADAPLDKNFEYNFADVNELSRQKLKETQDRNTLSRNTFNTNAIGQNQAIHHHQKKGVLKSIRFPFFSRNKSSTVLTTKDRKRKTSKNSKAEKSKTMNKENGRVVNDEKETVNTLRRPDDYLNKNKRSYFESICSDCKKRYVSNPKSYKQSRHISDKLVHNSRQFFQNQVVDRSRSNDKKVTLLPGGGRRRREFLEDKQRQLKELEEVAKKIESVTVSAHSTDSFIPQIFNTQT